MSYGALIVPEIGVETILSAGSRAMGYLGYYETYGMDRRSKTVSVTIPNKTNGSTLFVVPVQTSLLAQGGAWVSPIVVNNVTINNNVVTFHFNDYLSWMVVKFSAFEVLGTGTPSANYGVIFSDTSNYLEITSNDKTGCLVWKGAVTINGTWSVPSTVPGRANSVIFANWNDEGAILTFDNERKSISCWRHTGGVASNIYSSSVSVNIVVFSSGFNLSVPTYGAAIFNEAGLCTYSSQYEPFLISGTVSLNTKPNTWVTCPANKPLIPVSGVGSVMTEVVAGYEYWHHAGLKMSGNRITGSAANYQVAGQTLHVDRSIISPLNFPVLNLDNYF